MLRLLKINKILKVLLISYIVILLNSLNLETIGRLHNQVKEQELKSFLDQKTTSLILLTVTGDKRYKNKNLEKTYKELQIIHILIISAGNILLFLNFIQIFIHRINKTNFVMSLFFIYYYGKLISMPETFIRALQTISITSLLVNHGLKYSKLRILGALVGMYLLTALFLSNKQSYILSAIYSSVILSFSYISTTFLKSKLISFILLNTLLTITSAILFNLNTTSSICTTFIANIFISLIYDVAIYLAYITYLLPGFLFNDYLKLIINSLFKLVFAAIYLVKDLTYNVCYEVTI